MFSFFYLSWCCGFTLKREELRNKSNEEERKKGEQKVMKGIK